MTKGELKAIIKECILEENAEQQLTLEETAMILDETAYEEMMAECSMESGLAMLETVNYFDFEENCVEEASKPGMNRPGSNRPGANNPRNLATNAISAEEVQKQIDTEAVKKAAEAVATTAAATTDNKEEIKETVIKKIYDRFIKSKFVADVKSKAGKLIPQTRRGKIIAGAVAAIATAAATAAIIAKKKKKKAEENKSEEDKKEE